MVQMVLCVIGGTDLIGNQKSEKFDRQNFSLHTAILSVRASPGDRVQEETASKKKPSKSVKPCRKPCSFVDLLRLATYVPEQREIATPLAHGASKVLLVALRSRIISILVGFIQRSYMLLRALRTDGQVGGDNNRGASKASLFPCTYVTILHISRTIR